MLPKELEVLHTSHVGRVYTYIVRASSIYSGSRLPIRDAPPHRGQNRLRFFRNSVRLKNDF
mgnify:CR=1 FL=1